MARFSVISARWVFRHSWEKEKCVLDTPQVPTVVDAGIRVWCLTTVPAQALQLTVVLLAASQETVVDDSAGSVRREGSRSECNE